MMAFWEHFTIEAGIAHWVWGLILSALGAAAWRVLTWLNNPKKVQVKRELMYWFCLFILVASFVLGLAAFQKSVAGPKVGQSAIRGSVRRCLVTTFPDGFKFPSGVKPGFVLAFNLRLINPGAPSTAWGWKLRMTLPGKQQYEYDPLELAEGGNIMAPEFQITDKNYLPLQLLEKSVGAERGAVGWAAYLISNIPQSEIGPGTQMAIEIEQSDGTKRTIEHTWIPDGPQYSRPIIVPSDPTNAVK